MQENDKYFTNDKYDLINDNYDLINDNYDNKDNIYGATNMSP